MEHIDYSAIAAFEEGALDCLSIEDLINEFLTPVRESDDA